MKVPLLSKCLSDRIVSNALGVLQAGRTLIHTATTPLDPLLWSYEDNFASRPRREYRISPVTYDPNALNFNPVLYREPSKNPLMRYSTICGDPKNIKRLPGLPSSLPTEFP
jgi:hypothetical protein